MSEQPDQVVPPDQPTHEPPPHGAHERASSWGRLWRAAQPRATRAQALGAVLTLLLGLALVTQLRQTRAEGLSALRQSDLVRILDDVNEREDRLQDDARQLQATEQKLQSGSDTSKAALDAAQSRLDTLQVLTGTVAAHGPGIRLIITDPKGDVGAATLLDTVEELRDAGAEAIQIGTVRVVASTSFVDASDAGSDTGSDSGSGNGAISVDGTTLDAPYVLLVIGDPQTLAAALSIPGGVLDTVKQQNGVGTVTTEQQVQITALHRLSAPRYARPAPGSNADSTSGSASGSTASPAG